MRYFIWLHTQILYIKILLVDDAYIFALHLAQTLFHLAPRLLVCVNGNIVLARNHPNARNVVAVFMRNQNTVNVLHVRIDLFQLVCYFRAGIPCVYKHLGRFRSDINAISL